MLRTRITQLVLPCVILQSSTWITLFWRLFRPFSLHFWSVSIYLHRFFHCFWPLFWPILTENVSVWLEDGFWVTDSAKGTEWNQSMNFHSRCCAPGLLNWCFLAWSYTQVRGSLNFEVFFDRFPFTFGRFRFIYTVFSLFLTTFSTNFNRKCQCLVWRRFLSDRLCRRYRVKLIDELS